MYSSGGLWGEDSDTADLAHLMVIVLLWAIGWIRWYLEVFSNSMWLYEMQQPLRLAEVKNNILVDKTVLGYIFPPILLLLSDSFAEEISFAGGGQALYVETGQDSCRTNEVK